MHSVFGKQSSKWRLPTSSANAAQDDRVFGTGSFSARSRQSISRSSLNGFFRKRECAKQRNAGQQDQLIVEGRRREPA
jgi:hypothetical protein